MSERAIPACHGTALEPGELGLALGFLRDPPGRQVFVEVCDAVPRSGDARLVWQMREPPGFGLPPVTSQTWRESSRSTWFGNTLNLALRIDHGEGRILIATKNGDRQVLLEALASIALPMLAQTEGALVIHASAACLDGVATLLCAPGGSGKSSLLAGLIGAGWSALSEDQCVIELERGGGHCIWPGPNWVRFKRGVEPVWPVAKPRFQAADKRAWMLDDWMAHAPAALERLVFIDPPGGTAPVLEPLSSAAAVERLSAQATWLNERELFARLVLPQIIKLALSVPAFRLRLPFRRDWVRYGVALLTST